MRLVEIKLHKKGTIIHNDSPDYYI